MSRRIYIWRESYGLVEVTPGNVDPRLSINCNNIPPTQGPDGVMYTNRLAYEEAVEASGQVIITREEAFRVANAPRVRDKSALNNIKQFMVERSKHIRHEDFKAWQNRERIKMNETRYDAMVRDQIEAGKKWNRMN